jgi:hypothetical protein
MFLLSGWSRIAQSVPAGLGGSTLRRVGTPIAAVLLAQVEWRPAAVIIVRFPKGLTGISITCVRWRDLRRSGSAMSRCDLSISGLGCWRLPGGLKLLIPALARATVGVRPIFFIFHGVSLRTLGSAGDSAAIFRDQAGYSGNLWLISQSQCEYQKYHWASSRD